MEPAVIEHVALEPNVGRGQFPLLLARQALAGPLREGRRFVEARMAHRLFGAPRPQAGEREHTVLMPIERRLPAALIDDLPTGRQPELRPAIAAVVDEGLILAAGDEARRQRKR